MGNSGCFQVAVVRLSQKECIIIEIKRLFFVLLFALFVNNIQLGTIDHSEKFKYKNKIKFWSFMFMWYQSHFVISIQIFKSRLGRICSKLLLRNAKYVKNSFQSCLRDSLNSLSTMSSRQSLKMAKFRIKALPMWVVALGRFESAVISPLIMFYILALRDNYLNVAPILTVITLWCQQWEEAYTFVLSCVNETTGKITFRCLWE